ncbi:MAG: hypothetical protein II676_00425 [Bacteroidales bacterium]|nr:hypothetical protein [Bacteroidales bacterium]
MAKKKKDPMVLKEANTLLRTFSDLETLDKHYANFIESHGRAVYLALRKELLKRKRKEAWKILQREKKQALKNMSKVCAHRNKGKRSQSLVSLPSSKRIIELKAEDHKLPPARIIYTPMGNKR